MATEQKTEEPVGAPTEPEMPWWQRAKPVAAVTTILASAVPLTTAVYAHVEKQKEIELQAARQQHEIQTARIKLMEEVNSGYLDRLKDESSRLRTLRFLASVASSEEVRLWASSERATVESEIRELQQKVKAKEEEARTNEQEAQAKGNDEPEADRLKLAAARARAEANRLKAQVKAPIAEAPPPAPAADPCASHPIRSCDDYSSCKAAQESSRWAQTGVQNCDQLRDAALQAGCFSGPIRCASPPRAAH